MEKHFHVQHTMHIKQKHEIPVRVTVVVSKVNFL